MSEQESSPATATAEAVEELLRQLVDARFVLTDREGAVTRWSRPAEVGVVARASAGRAPEFGSERIVSQEGVEQAAEVRVLDLA